MRLSDFDYNLPSELIAQRPIDKRENSRLLVLGKQYEHKRFYDIVNYFKEGDVLVLNETKVLPAKLLGKKETGGRIVMILAPISNLDKKTCRCRIKGKVQVGNVLHFGSYIAIVKSKDNEGCDVEFDSSIQEVLDNQGTMPTPPYVLEKLKRQDRYQTAYAKNIGSIAAPTAGFHFSEELLSELERRGVKIVRLTLHVSFGTFTPIKSDDVLSHKMDKEYYQIPKSAADIINNREGRLFVVGTTSLKALESAAKKDGSIKGESGWSDLFLTPAYEYRVKVDGVITNFHLPKSTLLLLVAGLTGKERILDAYKEAVREKYRFYSFGDSMLILMH